MNDSMNDNELIAYPNSLNTNTANKTSIHSNMNNSDNLSNNSSSSSFLSNSSPSKLPVIQEENSVLNLHNINVKRNIDRIAVSESNNSLSSQDHDSSNVDTNKLLRLNNAEDEEFAEDQKDNNNADNSEEFYDLLQHFAGLEFSNPNKLEECPLNCGGSFPLSNFADHVYQCISRLDEVEKKELERLDEKYARELAVKTGDLYSSAEAGGDYSSKEEICRYGSKCHRTDANHFVQLYHPEQICPICSASFAVYEINAHINLCLLPKEEKNRVESPMNEEGQVKPSADLFNSSAFSSVRSASLSPQLLRTNSDILPVRSDEEEEGEGETGDKSGQKLTVDMASALSQSVLARRGKNDPGLAQLLDTFKTLGFTADNLRELKQAHQINLNQFTSNTSPDNPNSVPTISANNPFAVNLNFSAAANDSSSNNSSSFPQ
jgi:hypothetical protein